METSLHSSRPRRSSHKPFLMEVCERTPVDNKGGHLYMANS